MINWILEKIYPSVGETLIYIKDGNMMSFIKVPANDLGYPLRRNIQKLMSPKMKLLPISESTPIQNIEVYIKRIYINKPLFIDGRILIWEGSNEGDELKDLDSINIMDLQKITLEAIDRQECIVMGKIQDTIEIIKSYN